MVIWSERCHLTAISKINLYFSYSLSNIQNLNETPKSTYESKQIDDFKVWVIVVMVFSGITLAYNAKSNKEVMRY